MDGQNGLRTRRHRRYRTRFPPRFHRRARFDFNPARAGAAADSGLLPRQAKHD